MQATAAELARKVQALAVINEIALGITSRPGARRLHRFLVERIASTVNASTAVLGAYAGGAWSLSAYHPADAPPDAAITATALARFEALTRPAGDDQAGYGGHAHEVVAPIHLRLADLPR